MQLIDVICILEYFMFSFINLFMVLFTLRSQHSADQIIFSLMVPDVRSSEKYSWTAPPEFFYNLYAFKCCNTL